MDDFAEFNLWLRQLQCPESHTSDHVKNLLQRGVLGLLWEDVTKNIRPYSEVLEIRKNILLYKLKYEPNDPLIQNIRKTVSLKENRKKLDIEIKDAEERWRKQEFICRQKAQMLEKKKEERKNVELKKEILKIKYEQMLMQIENCKKMQEICTHLMPPEIEEIPQHIITDCLALVSNYSGGPDKRKVWNTISESLTPVKIPVLWNALLAARSHYTDALIQLDIEENPESKRRENVASIDVGIAKICSEHIDNVARRVIYSGRKKHNEEATIEYIEKIEQIMEELRPDLTDWLPLALEVKKLEILKNELERETAKLEEQVVDDTMNDDTLTHLIMEIKIVDNRTADCVQEIQQALGLLKSSGALIMKTKESLLTEVEKLQLLQTNEENQWLDIDLHTELTDFYNNIDINSLRKIMLKGEIGIYKHLQTCMNKASTIISSPRTDDSISNFPMLRVPIYYLIDYYKTFVGNVSLNKRLNEEFLDIQEDMPESPLGSPTIVFRPPPRAILELLRAADLACKKTMQHGEEFDKILKIWSNQPVRDVVSKIFRDKTVYGSTLDEWQKRFSMIVYVLQKANIHFT